MTADNISRELAIKLCNEIRAENKQKIFSLEKLQCWGCYQASQGDPERMCLSSQGGCNLINQRQKR